MINKREIEKKSGRSFHSGRRTWLVLLIAILLLPGLTGLVRDAQAKRGRPKIMFKVATVAPEGTTWMKLMHEMDERIRTETSGEVGFKFYAGGTQGSDLDVLRKMRTGQIHGGGLTGVGLGEIESSLRIMELPFMFRDEDEVSKAHELLDPIFEEKMRGRGFEILGWAELGFVYLYSKKPVSSASQLRQMKMWLWEGDPLAKALLDGFDVSPVPLNMTDVLTSLQTGIVNTVYSTPYGCLSLQWFSRINHLMDAPISYAVGAIVLSKKSYDRMNNTQKAIVRDVAADIFGRLKESTRTQNVEARQIMAERNVETIPVDAAAISGFAATGSKVWEELVGVLYERELLDRLNRLLVAERN